MNVLTSEQALNNLGVAIDKFVGTKIEHNAMTESFEIIKNIVFPPLVTVQEAEEIKE